MNKNNTQLLVSWRLNPHRKPIPMEDGLHPCGSGSPPLWKMVYTPMEDGLHPCRRGSPPYGRGSPPLWKMVSTLWKWVSTPVEEGLHPCGRGSPPLWKRGRKSRLLPAQSSATLPKVHLSLLLGCGRTPQWQVIHLPVHGPWLLYFSNQGAGSSPSCTAHLWDCSTWHGNDQTVLGANSTLSTASDWFQPEKHTSNI